MAEDHDTQTGEVQLQEPRQERNFGSQMARSQEVLPPHQALTTPRAVNDLFGAVVTAQPNIKPRSHEALVTRLQVLAANFGESYTYSWEVQKKSGGKELIEGGTIKLANDLAREYGNCCIDVREIDYPTHWVFYARFIDLETGFTSTRAFRQRKTQSSGGRMDADRMLDIAYQIGQSKAIRNVVLNALANYSELMQDEAKNGLINKIKNNRDNIEKKITSVMTKYEIPVENVERQIGRPRKNWTVPDVAKVYQLMLGIWDGMTVASEVFPNQDPNLPGPAAGKEGDQDEDAQRNADPETIRTSGNGARDGEGSGNTRRQESSPDHDADAGRSGAKSAGKSPASDQTAEKDKPKPDGTKTSAKKPAKRPGALFDQE